MIVRDEEKIIMEALESCYKFIDYYLICDTGSLDRTPEIIKTFFDSKGIKGEIFHDEWKNFGYNRNLGLKRAYNRSDLFDFVFWMDADDILNVSDGYKIDRKAKHVDGFYISVVYGSEKLIRLHFFNVRSAIYFVGEIHEHPEPTRKKNLYIERLPQEYIYLHARSCGSRSQGNNPEVQKKKSHNDGMRCVENMKKDPLQAYRMATMAIQCFSASDDLEECKKLTMEAIKIKKPHDDPNALYVAMLKYSQMLLRIKTDLEDIPKLLEYCKKLVPRRAEAYYYLAMYYHQELNNLDKAITELEQCCQCVQRDTDLQVDQMAYDNSKNVLQGLKLLKQKQDEEETKYLDNLVVDV